MNAKRKERKKKREDRRQRHLKKKKNDNKEPLINERYNQYYEKVIMFLMIYGVMCNFSNYWVQSVTVLKI